MTNTYTLEVCAFNIQSCILAQKAGAHRIELCDNAHEGGTTPSFGTLKMVREKITIPVYPIIRPRGGDFLYSDDEMAIMKRDIELCKDMGFAGVATGVQLANGAIDAERMQRLVEWAYPMKVTCHRVFDNTPDPYEALETLINAGCERILTSGQKSRATDGTDVLKKLVKQAGDRIIIMPGGGIRPSNLEKMIKTTGAKEYHSAARIKVPVTVPKNITDIGNQYIADEQMIRDMSRMLKNIS